MLECFFDGRMIYNIAFPAWLVCRHLIHIAKRINLAISIINVFVDQPVCSLINTIELTSKTNGTEIRMMRLSAVLTLKINACASFEAHS
jgi:hypothetical protein